MSEYPKVGSIVVSRSGDLLVHVWPDEDNNARTFTGASLFDGDVSCLWLRSAFEPCNLFKPGLLRKYRELLKASRKQVSHE